MSGDAQRSEYSSTPRKSTTQTIEIENIRGAEVSNRAITWCVHQSIPATPKLVLFVLCNAANDKDNLSCRRSHSLLAEETGLSRREVIRTIRELILNRRIEKQGGHADRSSIYKVLVSESSPKWVPRTISPTDGSDTESLRASGAQPLPASDAESLCSDAESPPLHSDSESLGMVTYGPEVVTYSAFNGDPRSHITNKPIKPRGKKKGNAAREDTRRAPFLEFVFQTRRDLVTDESDFKALKDLLRKTRDRDEYSLENLCIYWRRFVKSPDPFHRKQGKPLRYFCTNINAFLENNNAPSSPGKWISHEYIPKQK